MNVEWVERDGATMVYDPTSKTYDAYIRVRLFEEEAYPYRTRRLADWKFIFKADLKKGLDKLVEEID